MSKQGQENQARDLAEYFRTTDKARGALTPLPEILSDSKADPKAKELAESDYTAALLAKDTARLTPAETQFPSAGIADWLRENRKK